MKNTLILAAGMIALVSMSFVVDIARGPLRTCEYEFYVKCKGSNQFVEVIRAKDASTAKTMCENRYKDCDVRYKNSNGKDCK